MSAESGVIAFLIKNLPVVMSVLGLSALTIIGFFSAKLKDIAKKVKESAHKSAAGGQTPAPPPNSEEVSRFLSASKERYSEKIPPRGGRIAELLAVRGYMRVGEFSLSFLRALQFIRKHLGGWGAQYVFPWYITIGDAQSGKSELLRHSQLNLPVGEPDFEGTGLLARCKWWFFDHAIVLDLKGNFLFKKGDVETDERHWQLLLLLLNRYRPKRPLDGIILTISCEDLVGLNELDHDEHLAKAKLIYLKLSEIQDFLGMQVPVYVVVTKCDTVPGFQEFCQQLPAPLRQQIFGWSSPYTQDLAYSSAWVDEAFETLDRSLNALMMEMLCADAAAETRSEAFLFPMRFQRVKESLAIYVNSLFKASGYRDPFIFRGIFFTGQGHADLSVNMAKAPNLVASSRAKISEDRVVLPKPLYFVRDLLEKKIFREYSLAKPIQHRLFTSYRNIVLARAAVTVCLVLASFGAFRAFSQFKDTQAELLPLLYQIDHIISQKNNSDREALANSKKESPILNQQTQVLIGFLKHIQSNALFSIFIPSSWFDRLTKDINKSIAVAYETIIAQSIAHEFNQKFMRILAGKETSQDSEKQQKDDLPELNKKDASHVPTGDSRFSHLKNFTEQLANFEKLAGVYNTMVATRDHSHLPDITNYLFGFSLPAEALYYIRILSDSPHFQDYPKLDMASYELPSRRAFKKYLMRFTQHFLTLSSFYEPLSQLSYHLKKFGTRAIEAHDSQQMASLYRDVNASVNGALEFIDKPGLSWIAEDQLNFGAPYATVINSASEMSLLGRDFVARLLADLETQFSLFKDKLKSLEAPTTGHFFAQSQDKILAAPSEGLLTFGSTLKEFFATSFMAPAEPDTIKQEIPLGQRLAWDSTLLVRAVELSKDYKRFLEQKMRKYPSGLQETLTTMARENLGLLVNSYLAKAQAFVDLPQGPDEVTHEEALRAQVPQFKETAPMLSQLMTLMVDEGLSDDFVTLRDLLFSQIIGILEKVDELLDIEKLYAIKDNNFDWWDGGADVMLDAFKVKDKDDLKAYLESQRSRIVWMAKEFAQPLLNYLKTDHFRNVDADFTLINKWNRIVNQVEAFGKRKPGNSISTLENYTFKDINEITFDNCFDKILPENLAEKSGDYFIDERNMLRKKLYNRCESNGVTNFTSLYKKTSTLFNTQIARRFPFVPLVSVRHPGAIAGEEVKVDDLKEFFKLVDKFDDHMDRVLDKASVFSKQRDDIADFIKSSRQLKDFFGGFAKGESKFPLPTFKVTPEFRINRPRELSASSILDWHIELGDGQVLTMHDAGKSGMWSYGSPIKLVFGWADHGNMKPNSDDKINDLQVEGNHAHFHYTNHWALFWLIYTRLASVTEIAGNEQPFVLKFEVPETAIEAEDLEISQPEFDTQYSRFFVRLSLASQSNDGPKPITDIKFPFIAPHLDEPSASDTNTKTDDKKEDEDKKDDKSDDNASKEGDNKNKDKKNKKSNDDDDANSGDDDKSDKKPSKKHKSTDDNDSEVDDDSPKKKKNKINNDDEN